MAKVFNDPPLPGLLWYGVKKGIALIITAAILWFILSIIWGFIVLLIALGFKILAWYSLSPTEAITIAVFLSALTTTAVMYVILHSEGEK
jgi:hypothetical protein